MELRHLKTFYWITQLGSFAAAAHKLHTTQPNVSVRVRELEEQLGTQLFHEPRRNAQLTPKGRELARYAESVLRLMSELERNIGDPTHAVGQIRVGVTETVALSWLPDFITAIKSEYPNLHLTMDVGLTWHVWDQLRRGQVDLAFLPGPITDPDFDAQPLGTVRFAWMASPRLRLGNKELTPNQLAGYPVLSLPQSSTLYDVVRNWFSSGDTEPDQFDYCNSVSVLAAMTRSALGVSLLPPDIFDQDVQAGTLEELHTTPDLAPVDFHVVYYTRSVTPLPPLIGDVASRVSTFTPTK